jgi:predicted nucleotidyltransferase
LLSEESGIPLTDFGIRGSIALNMHSPQSDIDMVIYGSQNFRQLERTINKLEDKEIVTRIFSTKIDRLRRNKGRYEGVVFMVNAARKPDEIKTMYGSHRYTPVKPVNFRCEVSDDSEAMFRPAVYQIKKYAPITCSSRSRSEETPSKVVSMIGYYRNIARRGDRLDVSGMLEKVEHIRNGEIYYQVVVGTGKQEDERICVHPRN